MDEAAEALEIKSAEKRLAFHDITFQRFTGHMGDLHVVPEGIFLIAFDWKPPWRIGATVLILCLGFGAAMWVLSRDIAIAAPLALALCPILRHQILRLLSDQRAEAMANWRMEMVGKPLDQLVGEHEGSRWIEPDSLKRIRRSRKTLRISDGTWLDTQIKLEDASSCDWVLEYARAQGWPVK